MTDLRYPIGKFSYSGPPTAEQRQQCLHDIEQTPARLRTAVAKLSEQQLDTPYREGGWTVRQVVHHVPDSHLNAYVRLRLALTEEQPTVRPYDEALWAKLPDAENGPIEMSLTLLEVLHERWVRLWRALTPEQFARVLVHPDHGPLTVDWLAFCYAWHGRHHTAHITELRKQKGW